MNGMKNIVDELRNRADVIIVDAPPCEQMSKVVIVAECSDAAIYVIRQDFSKTDKIMSGIEEISSYDLVFCGMRAESGTIRSCRIWL